MCVCVCVENGTCGLLSYGSIHHESQAFHINVQQLVVTRMSDMFRMFSLFFYPIVVFR